MPKRLSIQARDKVRDMGKEKLDKFEPGSSKLLLFDSFVRLRISSSTFRKKSIKPWKFFLMLSRVATILLKNPIQGFS